MSSTMPTKKTCKNSMIKNIFWPIFGLKTILLIKSWSYGFCVAVICYTLIYVSSIDNTPSSDYSKAILIYANYLFPIAAFLYPYSNYVLEGSHWLEKQCNQTLYASSDLTAHAMILINASLRLLAIFLLAPITGTIGLFRLYKDYIHYKSS